MTFANRLQFLALIGLVFVATPPLGKYMAKVFGSDGEVAPGDRIFGPVERGIYRVTGVNPQREQRWQTYALSVLAFSLLSVLFLYLLQRIQHLLPLNPTDVPAVPEALSFNTAVSLHYQHELAELRSREHG